MSNTNVDLNNKRPYRKTPDGELHRIKNDCDLNPRDRANAEAEIAYRSRFWLRWTAIIMFFAALGALVTAATETLDFTIKHNFIKPDPAVSRVENQAATNGLKETNSDHDIK